MRTQHPPGDGPAFVTRLMSLGVAIMLMAYHVMQDGADFYLYDGSALMAVVTYPSGVRDFDTDGATKAREWFLARAREWNWSVTL